MVEVFGNRRFATPWGLFLFSLSWTCAVNAVQGQLADVIQGDAAPQPKWRQHTQRRTRTVWALSYAELGDKHIGAVSPVEVSVAPSRDGRMRVGFFESAVGGSGRMWEGAGWMATISAVELSGVDPRTVRISFDVSGRIDGPSAGALLTVGILAAIRDETIREDAAMTGTINPDGTIGPVGGISYKIEGAAIAGKKLVLIPAGNRVQKDENLDREVDLIERGSQLGVEVREVRNIYEAYRELTGQSLPRPPDGSHPKMTNEGYQIVKKHTEAWLAHYDRLKKSYDALNADFISEHMEGLVEEAEFFADQSRRLVREGEIGGAYIDAFSASSLIDSTIQLSRAIGLYESRGLEGMRAGAVGIRPVDHIVETLNALKQFEPKTIGDVTGLLQAYACFAVGVGYAATAEQFLSRQLEDEDAAYEAVYDAVYNNCLAVSQMHLARQALAIGRDSGDAPLPDDLPLEAAADFFYRAAEANHNVFETLTIEGTAKALGVSAAAVQRLMFDKDENYSLVKSNSTTMLPLLAAQLGAESQAFQYAKLGTAIEAYVLSSSLIATHYSLDIEFEDFYPVELNRDLPMINMLEFAEGQSRRSANLLAKHGIEARGVIASYGVGRSHRFSAELADRLYALENYWEAHVTARVIAFLAGFPGSE